jgi:hypothetical protein
MFQLTREDCSRCQIGILNGGRGSNIKYLPYAFTENGVAMLSSVLRSPKAIATNIQIMRAFNAMRKALASIAPLLARIEETDRRQIVDQARNEERFKLILDAMQNNDFPPQKIFYDGQIYDAFSLITSIMQKAKKEIILIDGYVDVDTLNILAKKNSGVDVRIYTYAGTQLTNRDVANFNAQYPTLTVKKTKVFHDRFIILDEKTAYHVGASIKDAGK